MNGDVRFHVLNVQRLPARLKVEDAAILLGCTVDDLRIIARAGVLRPLGGVVPPNAIKYYATVELVALMSDRGFLEKMTRTILRQHRAKNTKQRGLTDPALPEVPDPSRN